jgi:hypothetical protein
MPMRRKVNADFFKVWTPDMAYILGFFAADGYITVNKTGGHYWCIHIGDRQLLEDIRTCIGSNHVISVRKRKGNGKDTYRFQIGSIEMCEDLHQLGYWMNKTNSLAIPFIPEDFFRYFVRGYFDGDGHVWVGLINKNTSHSSYTIQVGFTSCSRKFLELLQARLVALLGVTGSMYKTKKACHRLTFSKTDALKIYDFMYNGLTSMLFLRRKRVVFEEFIKMRL